MRGMVEVTLVLGGDELLNDLASNDVACQRVGFTTSEFPIRRNMRGCSLPSTWVYRLHELEVVAARFVCLQWVLLP